MPIASRRSRPEAQLPSYDPQSRSSSRTRERSQSSWLRLPTLPVLGRVALSKRAIRWILAAGIVAGLVVLFILATWEIHLELAFYRRSWVREELGTERQLRGCFGPDRVSSLYNVTERLYGPRATDVHAGVPLKTNRDCYHFASTIHTPPTHRPREPMIFHSYWRIDLVTFSQRQEWFMRSLFATQPTGSRLILWSNGDLSKNPIIKTWLQTHPGTFETRVVNFQVLARGTALQDSELLAMRDTKAWIDGDLVRLLVLWVYGGVWVDMDSLLTRDLTPLLEHEFVTQWDCYGMSVLSYMLTLVSQHVFSQIKPIIRLMALSCTSISTLLTFAKPSNS
jgi:hypothetical protein